MRARNAYLVAIGFCAWLLAPFDAHAQTWPARPVTVVVPFAAGVTGDIVARGLVEHLSSTLGQPFIVDNRAGAGGNVGGAAVAKAAPDGYMLLLATTGPAANNKLMYKNMPYDPQRDFAPIVLMGKVAGHHHGEEQPAGENAEGTGRLRQGKPGQDHGRLSGQRHVRSRHRRAAAAERRNDVRPDAVSRQPGDHHRPARRAHRHRHGFDGALCGADPGEEAARAGDRRCAAVAAVAGRADGRRVPDFPDSRRPCGTRSSRRPARRRRSLRSSTRRRTPI